MSGKSQWLRLLRHFALRDLRQRWLNSFSGAAWALLQPLALLAIYSFVFVHVLRVRLPADAGVDLVPFLAAGLWPWTAFAESLNRATNVLPENAGLLAKVALPREVLVIAPVAGSFAIHGFGFVAVVVALALLGHRVEWLYLPGALFAFLLLGLFATGLALMLSALTVFVRDLQQIVGQTLTLAFFLTPIFYSAAMVPPPFAAVLDANPITSYVNASRGSLLEGQIVPAPLLGCLIWASLALALGTFVFRRLARHIEDYL